MVAAVIEPQENDAMAEFEIPKHSKRQIVEAGKVLSGPILRLDDEILATFQVAHNWRSSYAFPMHTVRHELRGKVVRDGGNGLTAGRLKRMTSIRRKLAESPLTLYQIQDIAGVRAILPSMSDVDRVARYFLSGDTSHSVLRDNNYVLDPKADGYRSRHLILKFHGEGKAAAYSRQFVEVQLRTKLQHAWATAVEAVGLVRNENLKAGFGSEGWRRFFALMGAEIAQREGQSIGSLVPAETNYRREELRSLNASLNMISELESYNQAINYADKIAASGVGYFMINFFPETRTVSVAPYRGFRESTNAYDSQDRGLQSSNAVLVEVDKIKDLKAAYPNYFLDVELFTKQCSMSLFPTRLWTH